MVGDSVIVLGREDLSSTLLSQRMRVGGTRLEDAVPVGVGNGSATWVDDDGVLFIVAQQEGATQSRLYYSPDQGESWLRAPTLLPRGSVLGGGGRHAALRRVDGPRRMPSRKRRRLGHGDIGSTARPGTSPGSERGRERAARRERGVLLAGDVTSAGGIPEWRTLRASPAASASPIVDGYSYELGLRAPVHGGAVVDGDYFLVGTGQDRTGRGNWIVRQLVCNR